ncbi:MAG: universal stress protein [Solirubrobacteraceae bacterium]|jgi:nucleotide-binding universal stress UspA family protein
MFENVIVGVDELSGGRDAIALATWLAGDGGEVSLAHVYIESLLPARGSPGAFKAGEARHTLEVLETARAEAGITAALYPVASSFVGRGLHELAEEKRADLLVVGSTRHGLLGRVLQGDDMRAALNAAPCAVAVAPTGFARRPAVLAEIGVGYDGSPESANALAVARELAAARGARVSVFQAVSPPRGGYVDPRHPDPYDLEKDVERAREALAALGDVEAHAAYGDPAEELALYGASVDLLIVGSRGYGPLGRLIHGNTSLQLARAARCPLLVLPRSAAADRPAQLPGEHDTAGAK